MADRQPYAKSLADVSEQQMLQAGMGTVQAESEHRLGRIREKGEMAGRGLELGQRSLAFGEKTMGERQGRFAEGSRAIADRREAGREGDVELFRDRVSHARQMQDKLDKYEEAQFEKFLDQMDEARSGKTISGILEIGGTIIGAMYGKPGLGQSLGRGIGKAATGEEGFSRDESSAISLAGLAVQGVSSYGQSEDLSRQEQERSDRQARDVDLATRYDVYRPSPRVEEDRWGPRRGR